jgi:hypothetical protein
VEVNSLVLGWGCAIKYVSNSARHSERQSCERVAFAQEIPDASSPVSIRYFFPELKDRENIRDFIGKKSGRLANIGDFIGFFVGIATVLCVDQEETVLVGEFGIVLFEFDSGLFKF